MRTSRGSSATLLLILLAVLALLAGCSPASGPLGTPSTPAPTGGASVAVPSGDATPGPTTAPSATLTPASPCCSNPPTPSAATTPSATAVPTASPTPAPSGTSIVRAYFMLGSFTDNAGLVPVLREIPATTGVATAAMRQLLAGPKGSELSARPAMYTAIPTSSKLLGLVIKGGTAGVDLSSEFLGGYNASRPDQRFAQVVYTLTQFSTVQSVTFAFDGKTFAGTLPGTRDGYLGTRFLPAIFVDRPAWGAAAGNPAKVSGVANVFEATFRVSVKDGNGKVLADKQVMASCGTGCWGDFTTTIAYTVAKAQWGTLRVYNLSPKDGTPENVTEYPVWLTPAS